MREVFRKSFFLFVALSMIIGNTGISLSFSIPSARAAANEKELKVAGESDKYTVCHATGSGTFNRLNISESALGGHFENNDTPVADHEDDIYLGLDNENVLQCPEGQSIPQLVPSVGAQLCGDGIIDGQEACDDNNTTTEYCGDGTIQSGNYCNADCTAEILLNEQCDDGSSGSGSCTSECILIPEECSDEDNLIVNGSFEEPVVTDSSLWQKMTSVLGWFIEKVSDNSVATLELHRGWSGNIASDDWQYAELDGDYSSRISQNVTTELGAQYKLFWSFAPRQDISAEQNHLSVELDGSQVATNGPATASAPLLEGDWTNSNYSFTANSTSTEVSFLDIGPSDSFGTFVDNVRLCKIADPEPETSYTPWCSALLGIIRESLNSDIYNDVADLNNDQLVNLVDVSMIAQLYSNNDNDGCYANFENPTSEQREFYFQCEDPNVSWCEGLIQGITDSLDSSVGDDKYFYVFDLNNDGIIDISDVGLVAQHGNDNVACYAYYAPPFMMCEEESYNPYCGDGEKNQEWEQCDLGREVALSPSNSVGCSEQCQFVVPQECNDLTLAKIHIDDVRNWGQGDMTSDLFLGSSSYKIPHDVWFPLYWNGSYFLDSHVATYEDVPGLAVQRLEDSLRVVMHGTADTHEDREHVDGYIEFWNASLVNQSTDNSTAYPGNNRLENGFDGTGVGTYHPANDEVWAADNMSHFWLTVTTADDGYYSDWLIVEDCQEEEIPYAPWCSALLGAFKAYSDENSPNYLVYNSVIDLDNDGSISLIDEGILADMYYNGYDEACYIEFDHPEGGYQFQCEDTNVGWCEGLYQGIKDSVGGEADVEGSNYSEIFDLNDDGLINLSDVGMMAQLLIVGDEGACYAHYVPPFEMCQQEGNPPVITLIGDATVYIYVGDSYTDQGATADDDEDGNITEDIVTSNSVDINTVGSYTVAYNVTDSDGNPADEVTRTVVVRNNGGGCTVNCGGGNNPADASNIKAAVSCEEVVISWDTSEDSLTWMLYGETDTYGNENKGTDFDSSHSVALSGLTPGSVYHYIVKTQDFDGAQKTDYDHTFTTMTAEQCGTVLGEKIEEEPTEPEPQVLGEKEMTCNFLRPSGSHGPDKDIEGVFEFPNGSLLRDICNKEMYVYLLRDQKKWHVPNWQYLNDNYRGQRIYNVLTSVLDAYQDWSGSVLGTKIYADGTLLRTPDHKIYVISGSKKYHIKNLQGLFQYIGKPIIDVDYPVLSQY
ncbi:DUF5011 domain-containing protein [Patescibacteria group bacterium]|nr:DUF5011 domain-containing protein [Patescibacteria group bacterium]